MRVVVPVVVLKKIQQRYHGIPMNIDQMNTSSEETIATPGNSSIEVVFGKVTQAIHEARLVAFHGHISSL